MEFLNSARPYKTMPAFLLDDFIKYCDSRGHHDSAAGARDAKRWMEAERFCAEHDIEIDDLKNDEVWATLFRIQCDPYRV